MLFSDEKSGNDFRTIISSFSFRFDLCSRWPAPICKSIGNPINLYLLLFQVAPMTAVPARKGATKTFQNIFLNQDAEQLCLPAYAR